MKKIKIFMYVFFVILILWIALSQYQKYEKAQRRMRSNEKQLQFFVDYFSKNPQDDFYDLYRKQPPVPYVFISICRLYDDRETSRLKEEIIVTADCEKRKMTENEFELVCDFEIFIDRDGKKYVLDTFTKQKMLF